MIHIVACATYEEYWFSTDAFLWFSDINVPVQGTTSKMSQTSNIESPKLQISKKKRSLSYGSQTSPMLVERHAHIYIYMFFQHKEKNHKNKERIEK